MADYSPFNPQYSPQEEVKQDPSGIADRWRNFLGDPASRAALISFGAQLAQPMAVGQNWMGHVGQAIGAAGEGATKSRALEMGDIERESKQVQREAQANAATSKAETAKANAETAAIRAGAYEAGIESRNALNAERAQSEASRRRMLEEQANFLFQRAQAIPDQTQADMMRAEAARLQAEARAGYLDARAGDVPAAAQDRRTRVENQTRDTATREGVRQDRATLGTQAEERRTQQNIRRDNAARRAEYNKYELGVDATNAKKFPGDPKDPKLSFEEWDRKFPPSVRGGAGGAGSPQSSTPPSPTPTQPPTQRASSPPPGYPPDAHMRADGNWWVERDGRLFKLVD